jgi:hypothetical protein
MRRVVPNAVAMFTRASSESGYCGRAQARPQYPALEQFTLTTFFR